MAGQLSSSLQSTPAITCMKGMMMGFNFLFWVSGIAILALGVWMKVQLYMYIELTTVYYNQAPYVLMGVGGGIVLIGSLGCLCTAKGNSIFLYLYSGFLVIIFIAELTVGISGFVYRGKLEKGFENGLKDAMNKYASNKKKADAMDGLQEGLKCCGRGGYADWFSIKWEGPGTVPNSVPKSCCIDKNNCKTEGLPRPGTGGGKLDIYTEGCYSKVTSFMEANFGIIGGVAIGFAFMQLFGALLACGLAKNINKLAYEQVA